MDSEKKNSPPQIHQWLCEKCGELHETQIKEMPKECTKCGWYYLKEKSIKCN